MLLKIVFFLSPSLSQYFLSIISSSSVFFFHSLLLQHKWFFSSDSLPHSLSQFTYYFFTLFFSLVTYRKGSKFFVVFYTQMFFLINELLLIRFFFIKRAKNFISSEFALEFLVFKILFSNSFHWSKNYFHFRFHSNTNHQQIVHSALRRLFKLNSSGSIEKNTGKNFFFQKDTRLQILKLYTSSSETENKKF